MNALVYIVDTLTSLYLGVLILRFIMQLVRANFRNPFADAILRLTNPLIMPLRRVLPPVGKVDTATVLAIVLFAVFKVAILMLLMEGAILFAPVVLIFNVVLTLVRAVLWLYVIMIFFYGIAGFLMQGGSSPIYEVLAYVCDPLLNRIRKLIPSMVAGLDLSFLWAIIALQALIILIGEIRI
ncbi:MAG TPA: YggT family protein [Steroidobacteraceae bacterium]|jgi:YggT family protein|nr:YggT family protein [Steroidobacteraceae bacterium]